MGIIESLPGFWYSFIFLCQVKITLTAQSLAQAELILSSFVCVYFQSFDQLLEMCRLFLTALVLCWLWNWPVYSEPPELFIPLCRFCKSLGQSGDFHLKLLLLNLFSSIHSDFLAEQYINGCFYFGGLVIKYNGALDNFKVLFCFVLRKPFPQLFPHVRKLLEIVLKENSFL